MRVKKGVTKRAKHKKILKMAKGMSQSRRSSYRLAKQGVIRSLQYAYRDRRNKKRDFRKLWTVRINAALRELDPKNSYSKFIAKLNKSDIQLDRKILAELAVSEPKAFEAVVKAVEK
jgi:large subunit ribosomal protein L20